MGISVDERCWLAHNIDRESLLRELAKDVSNNVRASVACNPKCPVDLLLILAHDPYSSSQAYRNPRMPEDNLRRLVASGSYECNAVAQNPACPPDLLRELSTNEDYGVRWRVASNPNTPADVLEMLSNEQTSPSMQQAIEANPSTPDWLRAQIELLK